jgi:hypothetical protein
MPFTTPNMGLRTWPSDTDPFDSVQLAQNFDKLDFHDHSGGRGVQIPAEGLADGAITSDKLASDASLPAYGLVSVYRSTALTLATGTAITFNSEEYDTESWYSGTDLIPDVACYYQVNAVMTISTDLTANQFVELGVALNGTIVKYGPRFTNSGTATADIRVSVNAIVPLNGTTDDIQIKTNSSASVDIVTGAANTYLQGRIVGRS